MIGEDQLATDATRIRFFAVVLSAVSVSTLVAIVTFFSDMGDLWIVATLAIVAALAERSTVRIGKDTEQSISLVPTLFAAVLFGPLPAVVVAMGSMLGDITRPEARRVDNSHLRLAIYTSSRIITGALAGLVALSLGSPDSRILSEIALATVLAALVAETVDMAIASATLQLRGRQRSVAVIRTFAPILALSVALCTPVVALLAYAYQEVSPWTLPLFLVPAVAAQRLFGLYQEQRELADDLSGANERLERANLSFAAGLVAVLDARDRYTAGHSMAVAVYSRDIARRMTLSEDDIQKVYLCGLVHDIGKIGLPSGLLEKPGALTLDERRRMQEHSEIGERILAEVENYAEIATIVRHHHERVDGQGYPDGLSEEDLPTLSRIIAVADAYDAMTSDRPYREAMPSRVARLRLAQAVGSQFDTTVVAAFEALLATADDAYRMGSRQSRVVVGSNIRQTDPSFVASGAA
ncbi:MAG: HD-GYP domain-containing protein [Gaiellaceae bacterium MAG52_C11]|nr:HD-GYP domain-containing protein [Candidatus Gaiellasilicea maunaloa]